MITHGDIVVRAASPEDLEAWQHFVDTSADAGAMHHAGWYEVLREAFWVLPHFLIATGSKDRIVGVLPLYESRSPLIGPHLSSLENGILATDWNAVHPLMAEARALCARIGANYLQIRGGPVDTAAPTTSLTVQTYIQSQRPADQLWAAMKQSGRRGVRKGEQQNVCIEHDPSLEHLDDFYRVYAEHVHQLGTPVMGIDAFRAIRSHIGEKRLRLYLVRHRDRLIGGMLCFVNRDRWTDYYVAVRPSPETGYANYLLYWHVIRDASSLGVSRIDLGRSSPHSNVHIFKQRWGGTDVSAPYHFYVRPGLHIKDPGFQALKSEKGIAQRIWSHLPLTICNLAGPLLRKQLPFI